MRASAVWRSAVLLSAATLVLTACGGGGGGQGDGDGGDGVLNLGYVLPETGQLAFLGPPQIQSVKYAVQEINDAGGVLGQPIPEVVASDEAGQAGVAVQSANRVLSGGVDALIGAAASNMSLAIIDNVTGSGVVQCSGSNTAATFTDYPDSDLYFRTAPSDNLQASVLSKVIAEDGHQRVAIAARADDYGRGLLDSTTEALESAGVTVVMGETYDPEATNFDQIAQQVKGSNPDAAVVVAFEEGTQVLQSMIEAGVGPQEIGVYGTDGLRSAELASLVSPNDPGVIAGMKGTAPTAENDEYSERLKEFAPDLKEMQFAPQVFDCVTIIALAAEAAQTDDPTVFAAEINGVTGEGEKCSSFADCKELLDNGSDIDYEGVSGPLDFVEQGEPGKATFDVYTYDDEGELATVRTEEGTAAN
ncbi:ABC transporter substrate-binding protein [Saccharomonospora piscinae]|uniref:Branched-chain amino acid ABC transporter substrate-binding protein n=1 Tax=Saccharomonospora piscinae TaxID=687388 RepID=A0A1V9A545_SACPI|nr:ABC transporter substrate-binding protein [Saccharomonospora piscinae]OQO92249.1 branched-chain amino acid ABC transporter substrate-binding protein [Saccharomonospora piscinae]TLW92046.1 amino acid ABC transporter substrate-binding protein [Saccharomonospora piscinae]